MTVTEALQVIKDRRNWLDTEIYAPQPNENYIKNTTPLAVDEEISQLKEALDIVIEAIHEDGLQEVS